MTDQLNPRFRFDAYVVGTANRLAVTAAKAVAESPGTAYNPLFVYGGPGLGKTHLLMAIGHLGRQITPSLTVDYITCDDFVAAMAHEDIEELPTSTAGYYYWQGVTVDAAAAAGAADLDERITYAERFAPENAYLEACVQRARARATGDEKERRKAADLFDAIGAAFERDVTLALGKKR